MTTKNNENSIDLGNYQDTNKHNFAIKKHFLNQEKSSTEYSTNSFQTPQVNKANIKPMKDEQIPNNSTSCPLKKIVLKSNNSQMNYNNNQNAQSYFQNKIVQLQQELLQTKKQSSLKQSSWIKEKNILLSKIQILNFENAQTKTRNSNLNQINQTLAQVLSQTNKKTDNNSQFTSPQSQIQKLKSSLTEKEKNCKDLQEKVEDLQKKMNNLNQKYNEQCQNHQRVKCVLEEYKKLTKQSNERKLQTQQKMLNFMQNTNILRQKILSLPVKQSYLKPIISFLKTFEENNINQINLQSSSSQIINFSNDLESSQTPSYLSSKPTYQQNSSYLLNAGKRQSKPNKNTYVKQSQYYSHRNYNNNHQYEQEEPSSIGYESSQVEQYQDNNNYWKKNKQQYQQAIYQCENCQNCFTESNFRKHMKECQSISELLKQKNIIQSRLISIQQNKNIPRTSNKRMSNNKSRLQLSQILNMSNISNNKSNCKKSHSKLIENQKSRRNSYIKKQQNQLQKQSMQEQIRKIVQALNEAGNKSNRSHISKNDKLERSRNQSRSYLHKENSYIRKQQSRYDDFY